MISQHMNAVKITNKQLHKLAPIEHVMEQKMKGIRCFLNKEFGHYQLITRGGQDVSHNFPHIIERNWYPDYATFQLDGELHQPGVQDEVVSGYANRQYGDVNETSGVIFTFFDCLELNGMSIEDLPLNTRLSVRRKFRNSGPVQEIQTYPCQNFETIFSYYNHILSLGGEGIMIKNLNSDYLPGTRRVGRWWKMKRKDDFDVVILGFEPGKGKYEGLVGSYRCGQYIGGQLQHICNCAGITDALRQEMTDDPQKFIGQVATLIAMEQDKKSFALIEPRHKMFRCDKRPEDCIPTALQGG